MLRHTPEGRSPLSRGYEGLKLVLWLVLCAPTPCFAP
jgi:hypothetical protein